MTKSRRIKLTDKAVERLQPPATGRIEIWDTKAPTGAAFGFRLTAGNVRTWQVLYRFDGKPRRQDLGHYPVVSLAEAREKARDILRAVAAGDDPKEAEKAAHEARARARADTFGVVVDRFITTYAKPQLRTWKQVEGYLKRDLAAWDAKPITSIRKRDIVEAVERKAIEGGPVASNRLLSYIGRLMRWCAARDIIEALPVIGIEKPGGQEAPRERVLTDAEITKLWSAWEGLQFPFRDLFRLALVLGQRRSEIASMRWDSIRPRMLNEGVSAEGLPVTWITWAWELAPEETKSARGHTVPLPDLAMGIIAGLPRAMSPFLFPAARKGRGAGKPDQERGHANGFSAAKRRSDTLSGIGDWRLHDLRRTVASNCARAGVSTQAISKLLNHAPTGVTSRVYNRHSYFPEVKAALDLWSKRLAGIVGIAQPEGIVDIAEVRAGRAANQ